MIKKFHFASRKIIKVFYIMALLFVLVIIFLLSSQDGILSNTITTEISGRFGGLVKNIIFRKVLHIIEYFVLMLLLYGTIAMLIKNVRKNIIVAAILCVLYATADEIHQIFVPHRGASAYDVLIDSAGILLGIIVICFYNKRHR